MGRVALQYSPDCEYNHSGTLGIGSEYFLSPPVLVVQADDYNQNAPTIIVAAVTSVIKKRYLPSHIILGEEFGLKKPSMVLLEQIRTVNREDLREYIGTVDDDKLFRQINATLKKTFGLWVYKPEGKENIRCLCPKCLNDYIHNPDYIVRRLHSFGQRGMKCTPKIRDFHKI